MLKISIVDGHSQRRVIIEGKLIAPWTTELRTACDDAKAELPNRELVLDVKNLTAISQEGENVLVELMNEGIQFRCSGVFTKHVLRQLARRVRGAIREKNR